MIFTFRVYSPECRTLCVIAPEKIQPYEKIWEIVIKIESNGNARAYHMEKNGHPSIGIAQIQQSRLDDFNRRTGHNYTLDDMYVPEIAKRIFIHYASEINPNNNERICREWNGGSKGMEKESTKSYWKLIQTRL